MPFGKYRNIGWERFKLVDIIKNYKDARLLANAYRKRGYKARIIESLTKRHGLVYAVYVRG